MTLEEWLKKKKITQSAFAMVAGTDKYYVNAILRGRVIPSRKFAFLIEKLTGGDVAAEVTLFPERFM